MILTNKIAKVSGLFNTLEQEIKPFKIASAIHCIDHCHHCCMKEDIYATVLEFLPAAYHLFMIDKAERVLSDLEKAHGTCVFLNPLIQQAGSCEFYKVRGLICRLFGFSHNLDKEEIPRLITCKFIKETDEYKIASRNVQSSPNAANYYRQLMNIDPNLGSEKIPINEAIRKAIEMVLFYYQFKPRRVVS